MRLGSAARAAESLCVAQSTLSGHLRKLSDALGVPLFELHGKQLVPTGAAQHVMAAADEVLDSFTRCEQALAPLRRPGQPRWRERADNPASWIQATP